MSMLAAGIYLRTLREHHGFSRAGIAKALGTSESQIERIEAGLVDTRGSLLLGFTSEVKGSAEQLAQLIVSKDATKEDGIRLAELRLGGLGQGASQTPEQTDRAAKEMLEQLSNLELDKLIDLLGEICTTIRSKRAMELADMRKKLVRHRPRRTWKLRK